MSHPSVHFFPHSVRRLVLNSRHISQQLIEIRMEVCSGNHPPHWWSRKAGATKKATKGMIVAPLLLIVLVSTCIAFALGGTHHGDSDDNGDKIDGAVGPGGNFDATARELPLPRSTKVKRAPNVVLFVLDDLGYADVGFTQDQFGDSTERLSEVKTPNIDALARGGVRFLHGYSSGESCAATRAGLMMGRYQQGVGIYSGKSGGEGMEILKYDAASGGYTNANPWIGQFLKQGTVGMDEDTDTDVDYTTGSFGKWHLGVDDVFKADADGIYRYKRSVDTLYNSSKDEDAVFPANGPLVKEDGVTPIIEGIPNIYSRIAPLGQAGSPYHPLYRGFDANHIFMGKGSKDYYDPADFYVSMDKNKPSLGKSFSVDSRKNPGNR